MWSTGYKQAWYKKAARSADATPMILSDDDAGRACPSAIEIWTRDVLDLYDQCMCLPGEISQLAMYCLHQTCLDHGCWTLNQLQRLIRIGGRPDATSVIELLMLRLDEQGLEVSSPWEMLPDRLLADVVWPQLRDLWNRKETWAGCSELDEDLQNGWDQAKQCLTVLRHLGRNGILTIQHFKNTPDSWIGLSDLRRRHCEISEKEYNTFLEWIRAAGVLPADAIGTQRLTPAMTSAVQLKQTDNSGENPVEAISRVRLPTCIVGSVQSIEPHDQIKLAPPPLSASGATLLQDVSNSTFIEELCRARAEISIALDGSTVLVAECLMLVAECTALIRERLPYGRRGITAR